MARVKKFSEDVRGPRWGLLLGVMGHIFFTVTVSVIPPKFLLLTVR